MTDVNPKQCAACNSRPLSASGGLHMSARAVECNECGVFYAVADMPSLGSCSASNLELLKYSPLPASMVEGIQKLQ